MRTFLRFVTIGFVIQLALSGVALADVTGSDFDALPEGPYPFGVSPRFISGDDPAKVRVTGIPGIGGGAPPPPHVGGNVLCIDNIQPGMAIPTIIEFDFSCDIDPSGICQLKYDFSAAAWEEGGGYDVYIDAEGVFGGNTDDTWSPPVIFAPSTIFGSNTEGAGVCDASTHTVTFVVKPGTIMYIDNLHTVCTVGSVPTEATTWGAIKATFVTW